jgi:hypothetical protein
MQTLYPSMHDVMSGRVSAKTFDYEWMDEWMDGSING